MSPLGRRMIEDMRHVSDRIVFTERKNLRGGFARRHIIIKAPKNERIRRFFSSIPASLTPSSPSAGEERAFGKAGAAVDDDRFAGDVARLVAREEHHRAGDFLRATETFRRDEVSNPLGAEARLEP